MAKHRIDTVSGRAALKPRREPYWSRVSKGAHLGFRKLTADHGTWIAKYRPAGGARAYHALGEYPDYDSALKAAREWFDHLGVGGSTKRETVKQACEAYVEWLRDERSDAAADDASGFFRRLVFKDPIARIELVNLKPEHVQAWRRRVHKRCLGRTSIAA